MSDTSDLEKTESPTHRRLEQAREKGQVARSRELNTLTSLLGAAIGLLVLGPSIIDSLRDLLVQGLSFDYKTLIASQSLGVLLGKAAFDVLLALLPLMLLLAFLALASPAVLGGFAFNVDSLMPKFERIDPMKGLGRIFSKNGLVELCKALAKFALVGSVIVFTLMSVVDEISQLAGNDLNFALGEAGSLLTWCFLIFSCALLLVAGVDVPWQVWQHTQQLMMTKQEVKDESKEQEGRPEVKSAIRQKQIEMSQRRMMDDVKKADVVITNPTHYAVAICYDKQSGRAPTVVAKGKDHIAAKIRELAGEHKVTIFSAPPLARALYFSTDLNQEIPEKLFVAVAQVLAYIYQLRNAVLNRTTPPTPPQNLPVPPELDKGMTS
ncbi:MAG: flagellar biosynthesis protein FlhB [Pseudomonadota bacterium]|nr:flagellar biosynthesis protein FlhB [Pseudomonadota bacterium]